MCKRVNLKLTQDLIDGLDAVVEATKKRAPDGARVTHHSVALALLRRAIGLAEAADLTADLPE